MPTHPATPITILTGFLGSGKTTLLLNILPQLPPSYKLCMLKNEFGDQAVDSQLASAQSISGVTEMVNGCICCNLTGQLGDALKELRDKYAPDRIFIETSGSAFPATLAMEINRLAKEQDEGGNYELDGVVSVIDVENWQGYEDTSVTAKLQAQYTDLVVFNKWEEVSERKFDEALDRLGDLEVQTPWVKSDKGKVARDVILGIDGALARKLGESAQNGGHDHGHDHSHSSEVDVLSVRLEGEGRVDTAKLAQFLASAPREEVYRIKGVLHADKRPEGSSEDSAPTRSGQGDRYILNWAFGRWTFTPVPLTEAKEEPALRLTVITAQYESTRWKKQIEQNGWISLADSAADKSGLIIDKIS